MIPATARPQQIMPEIRVSVHITIIWVPGLGGMALPTTGQPAEDACKVLSDSNVSV